MYPCVILFGSAARGEQTQDSDTDLLILNDDADAEVSKITTVEIQVLSKESFIRMVKDGDLFAIHVIYEGRVISDSTNFFQRARESLVIRSSYQEQRNNALRLLVYLRLAHHKYSNAYLVNKRIVWSVRTILISLLVEEGKFIFSPQSLCQHFKQFEYISELINLRRNKEWSNQTIEYLDKFIQDFLTIELKYLLNMNIEELFFYLNSTKNDSISNIVVLATIEQLEKNINDAYLLM